MNKATHNTFQTESDYAAYLEAGGRPFTHDGRPPEAIGRATLRRRREADWLLDWQANPMLAIERLLQELANQTGGMVAADFGSESASNSRTGSGSEAERRKALTDRPVFKFREGSA